MTYFERRYASTIGGGPVDVLGREGSVLCDRCGFGKHHRPTRDDDKGPARLERMMDDSEFEGWIWDPQDHWCWSPNWDGTFHPCDNCGRDANERISLHVIIDELRQLAVSHG